MAVKSPAVPEYDAITDSRGTPSAFVVLSCEVHSADALRACGYDLSVGRAFRAGLRRLPGAAWFVDGRIRLVGTGAPFDRTTFEARAEAFLLEWATGREAEVAEALRAADGAARAVQRLPDEGLVRRAARSRRQADKEARNALSLAAALRERVGRTLDGFPYAFDMLHRGTQLSVRVGADDPLLRIVGKGVDVSILWDGSVPGPVPGGLPSQPARSLALQAARRRTDPLQPMALLLKARWAAMALEAEAVRIETSAPRPVTGERSIALSLPAPAHDGWKGVETLPDLSLQVRLHDLAGARQIDAIAWLRDGCWDVFGEMAALSFRTGRREVVYEHGLDEEVARIAERLSPPPGSTPGSGPVPIAEDYGTPDIDSYDGDDEAGEADGEFDDKAEDGPEAPPREAVAMPVAILPETQPDCRLPEGPESPTPPIPEATEPGTSDRRLTPVAESPGGRDPGAMAGGPAPGIPARPLLDGGWPIPDAMPVAPPMPVPMRDAATAPPAPEPIPPDVGVPPDGDMTDEDSEAAWAAWAALAGDDGDEPDWDLQDSLFPVRDPVPWDLDPEDARLEDIASLALLVPSRPAAPAPRVPAPAKAPSAPEPGSRRDREIKYLQKFIQAGKSLRATNRIVKDYPQSRTMQVLNAGEVTFTVEMDDVSILVYVVPEKAMNVTLDGVPISHRFRFTYTPEGTKRRVDPVTERLKNEGVSMKLWFEQLEKAVDVIVQEYVTDGIVGISARALWAEIVLDRLENPTE